MDRIKGAIFDLDGTLLDSLWVWEEIDRRFLSERGFEVPDDYAASIGAMNFLDAAVYTKARFGLPDRPETLMTTWLDMARDIYAHEVGLKAGARETLDDLRRRGIKLGIATSSKPALYLPALESSGVLGLFDAIADTGSGRGKAFPDVYLEAATKLGLRPEECLVFEDLPVALVSAKSGGFVTIAAIDRHSESSPAADYVLSSFLEWGSLAEKLEAKYKLG